MDERAPLLDGAAHASAAGSISHTAGSAAPPASSTSQTPQSANQSAAAAPTRDDAIVSVAKVLQRHILHSKAEQEAKDAAARSSARVTPRLGFHRGGATSYGSTHSTPGSNTRSLGGLESPSLSTTPGGARSVTPTPPMSFSGCLNSPAIGTPYSSLSSPPQMAVDLDAAPHRYDSDVFDIDHYVARSYSCQVPLMTRVSPISAYAQKRQYHFLPVPTVSHVHRFIKRIFDQARLNAECVIIALIYIERMMETRALVLTNRNWIPIVSTALLISSKVQDDHSTFNAEFAAILPIFTLQQINAMERTLLTVLSYELYISSTIYSNYYFGLRSLKGIRDPANIPRYYHASGVGDTMIQATHTKTSALGGQPFASVLPTTTSSNGGGGSTAAASNGSTEHNGGASTASTVAGSHLV